MTSNDHKLYEAHEAQSKKTSTYTLAVAYMPHDHTTKGTKLDAATIKEHAIFVGLAALNTKRDKKMFAADMVHNIRVGSRSTLAFAISLLTVTLVSYFAVIFGNSPFLLSVPLLLLIKFVIEPLPAISIVWDGIFKKHKLEPEPHQTRSHSVWDGIIAGVLASASFFTLIWLYGFSPQDVATTSLLHGRALGAGLLALVGCYLLTVLSQRHSSGIFNASQLHNRIFGVGLVATVFVSLMIVYLLPFKMLGILGLPYEDLVIVFSIVLIFAAISELRRHAENTHSREKIASLLSS